MQYEIIRNRGVLKDAAPFVIDEGNALSFDFDNLPEGRFLLALERERGVEKEIVVEAKKHVIIAISKLKPGTYNVELRKQEGTFIVDKIICAPICVTQLSSMNKGLMCYPQIDEVIHRLWELEKEVAVLTDWKNEVEPKIHEHKIMK